MVHCTDQRIKGLNNDHRQGDGYDERHTPVEERNESDHREGEASAGRVHPAAVRALPTPLISAWNENPRLTSALTQ